MSTSLILCNKNDPFPSWILTCDEKWILYNNQGQPVQCLDWEEAPKHFPKPNLHRKKMSWSLFGHLLPVWYTTAFWIPVKPLHLRSMLSKSMTWTENCNACSWHWPTERAQFFTTTPDRTLHNQCFKRWMNWAKKFCLIHHIHLTTKHHDNFLQGKHFPNQQEAENAFQEFIESQGPEFLHYRNTQNLFLVVKIVLIIKVPIWIKKEISYKDLKFMVWNHNYFCTILITGRWHCWYWSNKWQERKDCK